MADRPSDFLNWCPDGSPTKVMRPTDELSSQGYVPNEAQTYQNLNYIYYNLDSWVQYLDGQSAVTSAAASLINNSRLLSGGTWSWNLSTSTLAWSQPFYVSMPGIADSYNQCATGNVTLADGAVGVVNVNIPFSAMGDLQSGSNLIKNITETSGISVGQQVIGNGIPSGTTVSSRSGNQVILSANASATANQGMLTFIANNSLTPTFSANSSLQNTASTVIFARRIGSLVVVGTNAGQMLLHDGESKILLGGGYLNVISATAGVAVTAGTAVYISDGTDGQTAGLAYVCDASVANGPTRSNMAGLVVTSGDVNTTVRIVTQGAVSFSTTYSPGALYYVDPANPGALTTTKPATSGQYIVPVGFAVSATRLMLFKSFSQPVVFNAPWPNYGVNSEAQLADAFTKCSAAGGGVILLQSAFSIAGVQTMPNNVKIIGRGKSTATTFALAAKLVMGSTCEIQDCYLQNTGTTGGTILSVPGDLNVVQGTTFSMLPTNSNGICVACTGSGNLFLRNIYAGTVGGTAATGISMSGAENKDADSTYTQG